MGLGTIASFILSLLVLDLAIYIQHRVFHRVPILWLLHRVHHSDESFDVTTALRFHPLEILLSFLFKWCLISSFGISVQAFLTFEVILNFSAMFNHSNFKLPKNIEFILSMILVTPSYHRVHHSLERDHINSNYGFCLSFWDRIFRSYVSYGDQDQRSMKIGLKEYAGQKGQSFSQLMRQPFEKK
jgi:sterol desaturase/sphingolipid hydroxylase (fatty acid hydroxylase superfamily)